MGDFNSGKYCQNIGRVIYEQLLSDFSINVDNEPGLINLIPTVGVVEKDYEAQSMPCHKIFLRAACPSLRDVVNLNSRRIMIDCDRQTLLALREFIYTGNTPLTTHNFQELVQVALKLELKPLQRKCLDFKDVGVVTEDNWLQLLRLATSLNNTGFISIVYSYLKSNSPAWIDSESFKMLTFDEIYAMLTSDNRPFPSHTELHKAILLWLVDSRDPNKNSHLPQLLALLNDVAIGQTQSIKTEALSPISSPAPPGSSHDAEECPPPLKKPKRDSSSSSAVAGCSQETQIIPQIPNLINLNTTPSKMLIFLVKSLNSEEPYSLHKLVFKPGNGEIDYCSKMAELPRNLIRFGLIARDFEDSRIGMKQVYMIGGIDPETQGEEPVGSVWSISLVPGYPVERESGDWEELQIMQSNPRGVAQVVFHKESNSIYLMGGQRCQDGRYSIESTVSRINLEEFTIREENFYNMNYTRERFGSTLLNDVIYMAGGNGRNRLDLKNAKKVGQINRSLEMLDLSKDRNDPERGKTLKQMNGMRVDFQLIAFRGKIWALGGLNHLNKKIKGVEIYDPGTGEWSPGRQMHHARSAFAAFEMDGHLYVVGGNDLGPRMERFDPEEEKWTVLDFEEFPDSADFSSFIFLNN